MLTAPTLALLAAVELGACPPAPFDPGPWLADLAQMRSAFETKYANLEWLTVERGVDLDELFANSADRLRRAGSDAAARALFDRLVRKIRDAHVELVWPDSGSRAAAKPASKPTATALCASLGYDARQVTAGTAAALAGYQAVAAPHSILPAGMLTVAGQRVGVLRIGVFQVQGFPTLCEEAVEQLRLAPDKACDATCEERIAEVAYRRLSADLEGALLRLREAGATVLLVDITENGGGSEWVEAVARMLTDRTLVSEGLGFLRSPHWVRDWSEKAEELRQAAAAASDDDRKRLLAWAAQAEAASREAARSCRGSGTCPRLGSAPALVPSAPAGAFAGKPWGRLVFNPAKYEYHDGLWRGPLIVLTDQGTYSAAEELAALLQDNRAAVVFGARTGGAGCGHTGEEPTTLAHSGAVLELPDCVRYRRDGSNEVNGIVPDVVVGLRSDDGVGLRARLLEAALPEAVIRARALVAP